MARFISCPPQDSTVLSSAISRISVETSDPYVDFILQTEPMRIPFGSVSLLVPKVLLSVRAYAVDALAVLEDPAPVFEHYLRSAGLQAASFSVVAAGLQRDFRVLHSAALLPDFSTASFLSLIPSMTVPEDFSTQIAHLNPDGLPLVVRCLGLDAAGRQVSATLTLPQPPSAGSPVSISVSMLADLAAPDLTSIRAFTVCVGQAQRSFFIRRFMRSLSFRFRNNFNAPETVILEGCCSRTLKVSASDGSFSGRFRQYDRRRDLSFSFTSGPLQPDGRTAIEELCASHEIWLIHPSIGPLRAFVTDNSLEFSDADDDPPTASFSFRLESDRHLPASSDIVSALSAPDDVFSGQFSTEFA